MAFSQLDILGQKYETWYPILWKAKIQYLNSTVTKLWENKVCPYRMFKTLITQSLIWSYMQLEFVSTSNQSRIIHFGAMTTWKQ